MPRHSVRRFLAERLTRSGLFLSSFLALTLCLIPLAQAQDADDSDSHDSHARIVRISYIEGEVRMDSGHGYENVTINTPVTEHNWLQTRSDGWVEVQLEDGSMIRLAPDTQIAFTQLGRLSSGGAVTSVDLDQGEAQFKITKHDDGEFQVTVKNKTISLVHSGTFRVTTNNSDPLEVVVFKGEVGIRDPESGGEVSVKKSETFVIDPSDVGRYALDNITEADELDQWSTQRDEYLSSHAGNPNGVQSPYQYGLSDLNDYGQYADVAGYGNVWQPNGVGPGWDPYMNGYWAYSPGLGNYWVSSYPWGWMPYRYGRWVFINGRGWCWTPSGWNGWHTGPRLVNAPPGFRAPVPPADHHVVNGGPGRVIRPGSPVGNGGAGGRPTNNSGGRFADRDGDNRTTGNQGVTRGNRRILTNEDVQSRNPRTEVPATPEQPAGNVKVDGRPARVEQPPAIGGVIHRNDTDRSRDDRDHTQSPRTGGQAERQMPSADHGRSVNTAPPARNESPSQPARQNTPPPQPAPVRQSAPPPPPARESAPVQRQSAAPEVHSAPPPASNSRSESDSRGRPK